MAARHDLLSTRDVKGIFYQELELDYGRSWLPLVASGPFPSDQAKETYPWLGMPPPVREKKGEIHAKGLAEDSIEIKNVDYDASIEVDRKFARRDKTGQLRVRLGQLADRFIEHWKSLVYTLINNGTGSTSGLAHDGQYFFDSDHSEGSSGTQLNLLTNTQVSALNVGTATAPTEAEMALAILGVIGYMSNYLDDQGEPMAEEANEWLVLCPFNLRGTAQAAVSGRFLGSGSGAVQTNPLSRDMTIRVAGMARLASTASAVFYVFRTDSRTKAFILQEEEAPQIDVLGEGSEHQIKTGTHLYVGSASRGAGFGHWWHAAHCTLS